MAAGSRSATSGTLAFQGVYRHTGGRVLTVGDYLNGIDCPSVGTCCAVGENGTEQGILATLTGGTKEKATVVPGTEYLYGIGCTPGGLCLLTGVGTAGAHSSGPASWSVTPVTCCRRRTCSPVPAGSARSPAGSRPLAA